MKKLLILLFSILISFNSYAQWTYITEEEDGDKYYIDNDSLKEHDGHIYWWGLTDYVKPTRSGDLSAEAYSEGDCGINRWRLLSIIFFKQSMGRGQQDIQTPTGEYANWYYPTRDRIDGILLNHACNTIK